MQLELPMSVEAEAGDCPVATLVDGLPRGYDQISGFVIWMSGKIPERMTSAEMLSRLRNTGRTSVTYGCLYVTGVDRRGALETLGFLEKRT